MIKKYAIFLLLSSVSSIYAAERDERSDFTSQPGYTGVYSIPVTQSVIRGRNLEQSESSEEMQKSFRSNASSLERQIDQGKVLFANLGVKKSLASYIQKQKELKKENEELKAENETAKILHMQTEKYLEEIQRLESIIKEERLEEVEELNVKLVKQEKLVFEMKNTLDEKDRAISFLEDMNTKLKNEYSSLSKSLEEKDADKQLSIDAIKKSYRQDIDKLEKRINYLIELPKRKKLLVNTVRYLHSPKEISNNYTGSFEDLKQKATSLVGTLYKEEIDFLEKSYKNPVDLSKRNIKSIWQETVQ